MAAKTLLRSGASIVTRFLNSGLTQKPPSSTQQKTLISSASKLLISSSLSNPHSSLFFSPQNDVVSSNNFISHENENIVEEKRLEIAKILNPCGLPSLEFFLPDADDSSNDSMILFPKRPFQPSTLRRKRNHGFFARKATKGGRRVIARRIAKGRHRITA
ncbi:hypothetical protein BVRB_7g170480 [Beta vulgaris subsp. vulgaris]|uniref:uncharacterized protein LOC104899798 n=1 Tax=Beta vulgaris subsp. vulgaris TaxID=3555 RepID=UPI00053F48D0|nr:uncharacterized protein LOC104899798 [Beta vulgaris subsp. vulgaris]XP_019106506.1 uncharacterized protein LOC104899798 [Beta vulgaris subsp. vulgaris]KMT04881.1 hypothetical protein BVRB_7g170480 [Beta vulgaris subsp. vulgaris]